MDPAYRVVPEGQTRSIPAEEGREVQEVELPTQATVDGGLQHYYLVYSADGQVSYALAPPVAAQTGSAVYCPSATTHSTGYQFVVGDRSTLNGASSDYAVGGHKSAPVAVDYNVVGSQTQNNAVLDYGVTDSGALGGVPYEAASYQAPGSPDSEATSFVYGSGHRCIVTKNTEQPAGFVFPKGDVRIIRYYTLEPDNISDDGIFNLEQYCAFPLVDRTKVQKLFEFEVIARRPPLENDPILHALRLRLYSPTSMGAKQRFWFLVRHWRRFRTMDLEIESVTQKNGSLVVRWASVDTKGVSQQSEIKNVSQHSASAVHI